MPNLSDNFLSSFLDEVKSRSRNPFLISFFIAFLVWNWKGLFFLSFSNEIAENKIDIVSDSYFTIENTVYYPLLSALGYTLIVPIILFCFEWVLKFPTTWRQRLKLRLDEKTKRLIEEKSKLEGILKSNLEKSDTISSLEHKLQEKEKKFQDDILKVQKERNVASDELKTIRSKLEDSGVKIEKYKNSLESKPIDEHKKNKIPVDVIELVQKNHSKIQRRAFANFYSQIRSYLADSNLNFEEKKEADNVTFYVSNLSLLHLEKILSLPKKENEISFGRTILE